MDATQESTDDRVIGPFREARRSLLEDLRTLLLAADAVTGAEPRVALASLDTAVRYLSEQVLRAQRGEEYTLCIAVDGVLGQPGASEIMQAQHRSVAAMAADLVKVVEAARADGDAAAYSRYLLPLLYGLYAALRVHLESEEDSWLPLLDAHLSESQVGVMLENYRRILAGSDTVGGAESPGGS